jgi:uncharacterized protein
MKRVPALILCLGLICFAVASRAAVQFPALTGQVVDRADLLGSAAEQRLAERLAAHERATGEQVVVVTLSDLQGVEIEEFGYQLGRHWKIGRKGENNGALLIVAPEEKAVRIEVGYGLEGRLTDAATSLIISRVLLPSFRKGEFEDGIIRGTEAILAMLGGNSSSATITEEEREQEGYLKWIIFLLIWIFLLTGGRKRRSLIAPLIIGSMLGSSGRGNAGRGIFRGGGGSFGGGGASGRW